MSGQLFVDRARPIGAELWRAFHEPLGRWIASQGGDEVALDDSVRALDGLLSWLPHTPEVAVQFALGGAYLARAYYRHDAVTRFAQPGLEAALIKPLETADEIGGASLLALMAAEADVEQGVAARAQARLDWAEALASQLAPHDLLRPYALLLLNSIKGLLAESALEPAAADAYAAAVDEGEPLVTSPSYFARLLERWRPTLFGTGTDLVQGGAAEAEQLLRGDLERAVRLALLGRARTTAAEGADAARVALAFCTKFGLPRDRSPVDIRRVLLALPASEIKTGLVALLKQAKRFKDEPRTAAWEMLCLTTHRRVLMDGNRMAEAQRILQRMMKVWARCNDGPTMAVVMADALMDNADAARSPDAATGFLLAYQAADAALIDSPHRLPFRALFDEVFDRIIRARIADTAEGPSRSLLSVAIDTIRSPQHTRLPPSKRHDETDAALSGVFDRIGRIQAALRGRAGCVALVTHAAGEDTLLLCLTGGEDGAILHATAGRNYGEAIATLARLFAASFTNADSDGHVLADAGRKAYDAMPLEICHALDQAQCVFIVGDPRAEHGSVPFELLHDGRGFLGVSKVLLRFESLRALMQAVEEPAIAVSVDRKALCAAIARVPGLPELIYAEPEVAEIRSLLARNGWDARPVETAAAEPDLLADACEATTVLHIAAHGERVAGREAVLLDGSRALDVSTIARRRRQPTGLVYLNTCSLGQSRYLGGGVSRGIAQAFVDAGAPCVIANLLPVQDRAATRIAVVFYEEALRWPAGEALRRTRERLSAELSPSRWASTVMFGDPDFRLVESEGDAADVRSDLALAVLDTYTRPDLEAERVPAFLRANGRLAQQPDDLRLAAALFLIRQLSMLEPGATYDTRRLDRLAQLAREIGHGRAEALVRYQAVQEASVQADSRKEQAATDALLEVLEPLGAVDPMWARVRNSFLAARRQTTLGPLAKTGLHITGPDDDLAAAIRQVKFATEESEEQRHGVVEPRVPERTLEDITWNAVLLGRRGHFPDEAAKGGVAWLVAEKCVASGAFGVEQREDVRRVAGGLLDFLWGSQVITYLSPDAVLAQARTLRLALEDLRTPWPANTVRVLTSVRGRVEDHLTSVGATPSADRFAAALAALDEITAAAAVSSQPATPSPLSDIEVAIEEATQATPRLGARVAAYLVGFLLEQAYLTVGRGFDAARQLHAVVVLRDQLAPHRGQWFMPYIMSGFEPPRRGLRELLELWRRDTQAS